MTLPQLAKLAVETYVREGRIIKTTEAGPPPFSQRRAGVFVTIKKEEKLRGCVGTYLPTTENIVQEIIQNALAAATKDNRFLPVQKEELPQLSFTVYVLSKPQLIASSQELDPQKYGVMVKSLDNPGKTGLLLPALAGIETIKQQISLACQKAEINPQEENIIIYKFRAEKYQ